MGVELGGVAHLLGTAEVMLMEDLHPLFAASPSTVQAGDTRRDNDEVGGDLSALGAAAVAGLGRAEDAVPKR
jgi:hypothetical protein